MLLCQELGDAVCTAGNLVTALEQTLLHIQGLRLGFGFGLGLGCGTAAFLSGSLLLACAAFVEISLCGVCPVELGVVISLPALARLAVCVLIGGVRWS